MKVKNVIDKMGIWWMVVVNLTLWISKGLVLLKIFEEKYVGKDVEEYGFGAKQRRFKVYSDFIPHMSPQISESFFEPALEPST